MSYIEWFGRGNISLKGEDMLKIKKIIIIGSFSFLLIGFWGCSRSSGPTMVNQVSLPTPTATPLCGFKILSLTTLQYSTPTSKPTVSPTVLATPIDFSGMTNVITSLAQWQTLYGSTTPPVDFNTQMILVAGLQGGCCKSESISEVCEDSSQVTVSIARINLMAQDCNMSESLDAAVVIPKTAAPIRWKITSQTDAF